MRNGRWRRTAPATFVALLGCATVQRATLPDLALAREEGAKLLVPGAHVRRCRGAWQPPFAHDEAPLLEATVQDLLQLDGEANALRDLNVTWETRSLGVYAWQCITIRADVVRTTSTILLPMGGGHEHHPH